MRRVRRNLQQNTLSPAPYKIRQIYMCIVLFRERRQKHSWNFTSSAVHTAQAQKRVILYSMNE